jgi:malate dehydrogenase (quinone)
LANISTDVLLVGGGIMSATLGTLLSSLNPNLRISMVEQLPNVALESSDALNNAGTGHAGYCELNYTPEVNGQIAIQRALEINANFEVSLQFWSSLIENGVLNTPEEFINKVPHLSYVWGKDNVAFLKQRHTLLSQHPLFADMLFSNDPQQLKAWMPLMMHTERKEPVAATFVNYGTDVNFGALTRALIQNLQKNKYFTLHTNTKINRIRRLKNGDHPWSVSATHLKNNTTETFHSKFVFLGAGGGALPLLQKSKIPESLGYGGFPVSGQWLICNNPAIIKQHSAKVYGKAAVGAPPMSVPHLDTRVIDGKSTLLFGPFAGFTTKFLKEGHKLDLAKSIKPNNLKALLGVAKNNVDLTKYLIKEARQTHEQRVNALRDFLPDANPKDWELAHAGQRVQIIKKAQDQWGKLEFGTEIVAANDGTLAALLGASPGASVSVMAMINVIEKCFSKEIKSTEWQSKLCQLIPSYGQSLIDNADLLKRVRQHTLSTLKLQ